MKTLETEGNCKGKYAENVVRGYRKVLNVIRAAKNEHDVRAMKSLNFEKLKGGRSHQHSLRINKQWRLIVEIETRQNNNIINIKSIEDYH